MQQLQFFIPIFVKQTIFSLTSLYTIENECIFILMNRTPDKRLALLSGVLFLNFIYEIN